MSEPTPHSHAGAKNQFSPANPRSDPKRDLIAAVVKQLPPSASRLHLLDVQGESGSILAELRTDLDVQPVPADAARWNLMPRSADAVVAYNLEVTAEFLAAGLTALRPGGRLVVVQEQGQVSEAQVETLEKAGYTRILVEPALDDGRGVLLRGERPHTTTDTLERIQQVARGDGDTLDFAAYKGRYVFLLVRQTPNKPAWKLQPGEAITWHAAAVESPPSLLSVVGTLYATSAPNANAVTVLAFSSLPKAVAFMQPAVMSGLIKDVNKVARFSREMAQTWSWSLLLNPTLDLLEGRRLVFISVDVDSAEAPDE